jgi:5'-3' exonuclease
LGPKFAQELLNQYKSIKEVFSMISSGEAWDMNEKTKTALLKNKDLIELSYNLAKARTDAPVVFERQKCQWGKFDKAKIEALFREYKFFSLINRL